MLVCQLPAAFRRLPRLSSPVIAKASTTCTYSLDPITVRPRQTNEQPQVLALRLRASQALLYAQDASIQSSKPSRLAHTLNPKGIPSPSEPLARSNRFTSSTLLKNSRFQ